MQQKQDIHEQTAQSFTEYLKKSYKNDSSTLSTKKQKVQNEYGSDCTEFHPQRFASGYEWLLTDDMNETRTGTGLFVCYVSPQF